MSDSITIGSKQNTGFLLDDVQMYKRGLEQHEIIMTMNSKYSEGAVGKDVAFYHSDPAVSRFAHFTFDAGSLDDSEGNLTASIEGTHQTHKVDIPTSVSSMAQQFGASKFWRAVDSYGELDPKVGSGLAILLDGVDDLVTDEIPSPTKELGMLVELYFKIPASAGYNMALGSFGSISVGWTKSGGLGVHVPCSNSQCQVNSKLSLNDNVWHSLSVKAEYVASMVNYPAVIADKVNISMHIDNAFVGSKSLISLTSLGK